MFLPPDRATRTRYLVAEIVVVLLIVVSLGVAYRIGPQWISRHVTLLNLWPPRDAEAWSTRGRGLLVLLAALVVLGLRPALMFVASKGSLTGLMGATVPALLAITVSVVLAEALVGRTQPQALKGGAVSLPRPLPHPRYGWTWLPSTTPATVRSGRSTNTRRPGSSVSCSWNRIFPSSWWTFRRTSFSRTFIPGRAATRR